MSYTNETMPDWVPRVQVDKLTWKMLQEEKKFWAEEHTIVVRKLENMVEACKEYGHVNITWMNKTYRFTMEEKDN